MADPRGLEDFRPRSTEEALLGLHIGLTIQRKADAVPEWVLLFLEADEAQFKEFAQALEGIENPVSSLTSLSHATRARTSWGLAISPEKRAKMRRIAHQTPSFVFRRLRHVARLTARARKTTSERDEKRIEKAWREIRQRAAQAFDDFEESCDSLWDEFWSEIDRLRGKAGEPPKCGARCRSGQPCRMKAHVWPNGRVAKRCRLHGGATPRKPKSPEGRAAIAQANRKRAKPQKTSDFLGY